MIDAEQFLANVAGYAQATGGEQRRLRLAAVDSAYTAEEFLNGVGPRVVFDGESTVTRKRWPVLAGYWPRPGDRVLMLPAGRLGYIVVGSLAPDGSRYVGGDLHVAGLAPGREVFKALRNTNQSISSNGTPQAANALSWGDVHVDLLGAWTAAEPTRFTPPTPGRYILSGMVGLNASTAGEVRGASWFINGSAATGGQKRTVSTAFANTYMTVTAPTIGYEFNGTTDYAELVPAQDTGGALNTATGTAASIMTVIYGGPA